MGLSGDSLITDEIVEKACHTVWGDDWPNVPNAEGERGYMRRALEAVTGDIIEEFGASGHA